MKRILKVILACITAGILAFILYIHAHYEVPILAYHHFGYGNNTLSVTPENFDRQMRYLKQHGYTVISLDRFVDGLKNGRTFKRNTVVITVDDGYRDNYQYAYPVLRKYGFPATIFLWAANVDADPEFLTSSQIREMYGQAISFGSHTLEHQYLPSISDTDAAWQEIAGSKQLLERILSIPIDYFCYPTGGFTDAVKVMVIQAGYKGACTTNRGASKNHSDLYALKRVKITNADTNNPFSFMAKLSGHYNLFRRAKKSY